MIALAMTTHCENNFVKRKEGGDAKMFENIIKMGWGIRKT